MTDAPSDSREGHQAALSPRTPAPAFWGILRSRILLGIAALALMCLTFVVCYDVFLRYVMSTASRWGFEVSTYLMAVVVTFGAAHTLSVGAQIRVDVVYERLTGRRRAIADAVAWLTGVVFCSGLVWAMGAFTWRSFRTNAHSMDLGLPLALPQGLVTAGALAVLIECFVLLVGALRQLGSNPK